MKLAFCLLQQAQQDGADAIPRAGGLPAGTADAQPSDAGLRGHAIGGAQVSEKHCGFIVNADHATAADVDELIRHIQTTVKDQFDVDLEPEVHRVGEFL